MKSWRRQALFQSRHCFCPTPTLGGGGSSQGGRHPLTALSTVPSTEQGVPGSRQSCCLMLVQQLLLLQDAAWVLAEQAS